DKTVIEGTTLTITARATDADGDKLTYSLGTNTPTGMAIKAGTGVITWTPGGPQAPSTNQITVQVIDDGTPPMSDSTTFNVFVVRSNTPPVLSTIPDQLIESRTNWSFTAKATDADGNKLTFSLGTGAPSGISI